MQALGGGVPGPMASSFFEHLSEDVLLQVARILCRASHTGRRAALNAAAYALLFERNSPFVDIAPQLSNRLTVSFADGYEPDDGVWLRYTHDPALCEHVLREYGWAFRTLRIADFPPHAKLDEAKRLLSTIAKCCTNVRELRVAGDADALFWRYVLEVMVNAFGSRLHVFEVDASDFSVPFCRSVARAMEQKCQGQLRRIAILNAFRLDVVPWSSLGESLEEIALSATQPIDWAPHFSQIRAHCRNVHTIELDIGRCGLVTDLLCSFGKQMEHVSFLCPPQSECERVIASIPNAEMSLRAAYFDLPSVALLSRKVRHLKIAVSQEFEPVRFAEVFDLCDGLQSIELDAPYCGDRAVSGIFQSYKPQLKSLVIRARKVVFGYEQFQVIATGCNSLSHLSVTARVIEGVKGFSSHQNQYLERVELKETGVRLTENATMAACSTLRNFHDTPSLQYLRVGYYACGDYAADLIENAMLKFRKIGTSVFVCGTSGVITNM